jgi:hypothetical protein
MTKFTVTLTARIIEVAQVVIEAADEVQAEMIARRDAPQYDWERLDNDSIEVEIESDDDDEEDTGYIGYPR